jgi:ABC-type glycerol-3-phosphate transport system substrate-binding protein
MMAGLACIVLFFGLGRGRRRVTLGLLLFGLSAAFFAGCGGSSSTNVPASSQITITAAGSNGTTHQSTFNLKPQ